MTNAPTPPIALRGGADAASSRLDVQRVQIPDSVASRLATACEITVDAAVLAEASRDWWPLAMTWAADDQVASLASMVARPHSADGLAEILRICNESRVPVTAIGGRSGVCGGSVPLHGGVVLDLTGLSGIRSIDTESMVVDVAAGTFGDDYEAELRNEHQITGGHHPQSMTLSTVGGWLACRSAGQYSTRYGKIEDIVIGLDVVLADGTQIVTGGAPRAAVGPDLNQLFVGSEGTLGVITGARLRVHPLPAAEVRRAFGFASFEEGLDACRRIMHRGATPAVVRLYDDTESGRNFDIDDFHVLLVLDEADPEIVTATAAIVDAECREAEALDSGLVEQWLGHRNNVGALESLIGAGFVVDTMEVAAPWAALERVYRDTIDAIAGVEGTMAVSAHQSHSYRDGACIYVTFAGHKDVIAGDKDGYYRRVWDAGSRAALAAGAGLSHHHGVGLNRSTYMREALGTAMQVLVATKAALDPNGILNPGKLGLPDPWG